MDVKETRIWWKTLDNIEMKIVLTYEAPTVEAGHHSHGTLEVATILLELLDLLSPE